MAAPLLIVKQNDTYPSWLLAVTQGGAWLDLSDMSTMTLVLKCDSPTTIVTGFCSGVAPTTVTATLAEGNPALSAVSSFTAIRIGATLTAEGIPDGTSVEAFDSVAGTITMTAPASINGSSASVTVGKGQATFTPTSDETSVPGTYATEVMIVWSGAGTPTQTIPNAAANNPTIEIDSRLDGSTG